MEVVIKKRKTEASILGAKIIAKQIKLKYDSVLGFATGSSPLLLYNELVRMHREEKLSFNKITTFNLDEYVGLDPNHKSSYHSEMNTNLFSRINISQNSINLPNGCAPNIPLFCQEYENSIKTAGGIDIQLLGIGKDGHLAFNEPGSSLASRTRIKTLTKVTIEANRKYFSDVEQMPTHVLTMGIGTIMEAKQTILLAFGENKADAVKKMIEGPVSTSCPASILQFHEHAIILLDEGAASKLARKEHYIEVYSNKPKWQQWE